MKEIIHEYSKYTYSLLSLIKIVNICSQKFIFRRFVIVWPFTIPKVITLIVDYLWTVLMPPCGMWRAVILNMGTVQINFPTNFQSNLLPYSYGQHLPPKTWHLPVKSTRCHVLEDSNFHIHRCENLKFDSTQSVNLIYHEHFPSSAFHRKKQYSIIVKFLFVCRFVFYVNVNNFLPEMCTCIYYVHRLCVFCYVLFI